MKHYPRQDFHHHHARGGRRRDDTSSILDSPEMPMSIRSPSMSTLGGGNTPDRASPFSTAGRPSLLDEADPMSTNHKSGMKSHPSAASIPIILAGLNGLKAVERKRRSGTSYHFNETSDDMETSAGNPPGGRAAELEDERGRTPEEEQRGSIGSIGLGLGILQEPIQLMSSRSVSNSSTGTKSEYSLRLVLLCAVFESC